MGRSCKKNIKLAEIIEELKKIKPEIVEKFYVKEIGIFGSYVRNEEKLTSDIDILVEFSRPIGLFKFMDLEDYLKKRLGIKVDLVSKKALKPYIGEKVLKEAIFI